MRVLRNVLVERFAGLRGSEYVLLITDESLAWCRISSGGRWHVLLRTDSSAGVSQPSLEDFCTRVAAHKSFFGQPCRVLVGGGCGFTYVKRLREQAPVQVLRALRTMRSDTVEARQISRTVSKTRLFVYSAVEKKTLDHVFTSVGAVGMPVTGVVLLPVQLLVGSLPLESGAATINIYRLSDREAWFLLATPEDHVLVERVPESCIRSSAESTVEALRAMYIPDHSVVRSRHYSVVHNSSGAAANCLRIGRVLASSLRTGKFVRSLAYRPATWRRAETLRVALNSSRLLGLTLASMLLLLLVAAGITSIPAARRVEGLDAFQEKYNAKSALDGVADSLRSELQRLASREDGASTLAPVLSAFCQHSVGGLSLTGLSVTSTRRDSLSVTIQGVAQSARAVFDYKALLSEAAKPFRIRVGSVSPEVSTVRGNADSLYSFTIIVSRDEGSVQE